MKKYLSFILFLIFSTIIILSYHVRIGDTLGVWFFGYEEYSSSNLLVGPEGKITLPPIGQINVVGKDVNTIEQDILYKIQEYVRATRVTVGITLYSPFEIKIFGNVLQEGIIDMKSPEMKLSSVLARVGGLKNRFLSNKALIRYPDGTEKIVDISWLSKGIIGDDPTIYENTFIFIPYQYNNKVNVFSDFGSNSFDYYEQMGIRDIISELNISSIDLLDTITVIRNNQLIELSFESIIKHEDFILLSGDNIVFNKHINHVYVFSDNITTKVNFEKYEDMTLDILLTKINLDPKDISSVYVDNKLYEDNQSLNPGAFVRINLKTRFAYVVVDNKAKRIEFDKNEEMNIKVLLSKLELDQDYIEKIYNENSQLNNDSIISSGEFIYIDLIQNHVYVFSDNITTKVNFEKYEDMTLDILLTKINLDPKDISSVYVDNKLYEDNQSLNPGAFVRINLKTRFAYVVVDNKAKRIEFDKNEEMNIKVLLSKLELDQDYIEKIYNENSQLNNDSIISSGEFIYIDLIEFYVYALFEDKAEKIYFSPNEDHTVKILLTKLGINPDVVENVIIDNKKVNLNNILEKHNFVRIEKIKKNIYLSGAFSETGKITFNLDETITLNKVISLSKGFKEDYSGIIYLIQENGQTKEMNISSESLYKYANLNLENYSYIIAGQEKRNVYIFGEYSDVISYSIGDTLYEVLLPYNLNDSYSIRYQIGENHDLIKATDYNTLQKIILNNQVFIEIILTKPNKIIVYKMGEVITLDKAPFRIIDILSSVEGFSPVDKGIIEIYEKGEKISTYTLEDIFRNPLDEIKTGTYAVVIPNISYSQIHIMGNTIPKNIRTDYELNLIDILSRIEIAWDKQNTIIIYNKDKEKEVVKLDDIELLRKKYVNPGSIIYIPPIIDEVVYVFGEINRPGIVAYTKNMTLIDAILKSGDAKNSAQLSNVYLFKDGADNPPINLDLSNIIKKAPIKSGMNPELTPGDIIFIPKNTLTSVFEVMNIVGNFMQFINTGFTTYENISSLF